MIGLNIHEVKSVKVDPPQEEGHATIITVVSQHETLVIAAFPAKAKPVSTFDMDGEAA